MRVLFIYQFLTLGGVESVLRNRYVGLKRLDPSLEIQVLFLKRYASSARDFGDQVIVTDEPGQIASLIQAADVVSVIDTPQLFEQIEAAKRPTIVEVHTPYVENRQSLKERLPSCTRLLLTPSRAFRDTVASEVADTSLPVEYVHNPLDADFFEEGTQRSGMTNLRSFRPILWVGRFDELKDWERAVRIASKVFSQTKRTDVELFMVGRHPDPRLPLAHFRQEGVLGRVRYLSDVSFSRMRNVYSEVAQNRGIYLSTSKGETFGMTIAESMALGVPCVLHDLPVFHEVTDENAAFFRSDKEAVEQILEMLERDDQSGENKRRLQRSVQRFRPEVVSEKLLSTLRSLAPA